MRATLLTTLAVLWVTACSAGGDLTSIPDSGAPVPDAGEHAGKTPDAGTLDAGPSDAGPDAGPPDAGSVDIPDAGPVTCVESDLDATELWVQNNTPAALPQDKGRLLNCWHVASNTLLQAQINASPYVLAGIVAENGYNEYVIQYVSESPPGTLRHVSALVYLPDTNAPGIPLVSLGHATNGIGSVCGVTHNPTLSDYMALPLVVQGFAVVATDYVGMGVPDGISPYSVGWAEGTSILDAAKAVTQIHDPGRFDESQLSMQLELMGHSQGGQSTLFAHQLYTPDSGFDLLGSVSFAPAYGDLRGQEYYFGDAGMPTADNVFLMAMGMYAYDAYYGATQLSDWLTPDAGLELPEVLATQCFFLPALAPSCQATIEKDFPTLGDLFRPEFALAASTCGFDGGLCSGIAPFDIELSQIGPGDIVSQAPVLILQGEADTTVYPETTACVKARIDARATPEQTCGYAGDDHYTVVTGGIGDAIRWMEARLSGQTPDVCPPGGDPAPLKEICLPDGPGSPDMQD